MRIDAHLHCWQPACGFDNKPIADHPAYRRDFLLEDVARELDACGIDGVVLVQACPQVEETAWLLGRARREPRVLGVVGWVDLADAALDVASLLAEPGLVGIRAQLRRVSDPRFVLDPRVLRNLARLLDAGLGVTLLAEPRHYAPVAEALLQLPAGPITVNHLALRGPDADVRAWRAFLGALAARPDTFLLASGLPSLFGERWQGAEANAVLDDALSLLGAQRLVFASDWPMLVRFATYTDWVRAVERFADAHAFDAPARDALFGGNALAALPRLAAHANGRAPLSTSHQPSFPASEIRT